MLAGHWFMPSGGMDYKNYTEMIQTGKDTVAFPERHVKICNEIYAEIHDRARFHDKKIYECDKQFYKHVDIAIIQTRVRPVFAGLIHADALEKNCHNGEFTPLQAINLLAVIESFIVNGMNKVLTYKQGPFTFSVEKRHEKNVLCISYGEGLKKSYIDKCYCKMAAGVLRSIISTSEYGLY